MTSGGDNNSSDSRWTVLVLDHKPHLDTVTRAISGCGGTVLLMENRFDQEVIEASATCAVVVVGLDATLPPMAPILSLIRALSSQGFHVVAYADGTDSWRPSERCRPLLAGASDVLNSSDPMFEKKLKDCIARMLSAEKGRAEEECLIHGKMAEVGMVGQSSQMMALFRNVIRIGRLSDMTVLITGESGTGKELVAQAVHHFDPKRRKGPFINVNSAAFPPNLVESQLFGHRRGAFTGAVSDRKGLIRAAHGGILFLDEIGECEPGLQAKLLRVIQEKRVLGVGEEQEVAVDLRLVAATNRNLKELVEQGRFRRDLFERINVIGLHIPPLRERRDDLPPLIQLFLEKHRSLSPNGECAISQEFVEALSQLDWPGNARELENLVCRVLAKKQSDTPLSTNDLPPEVWEELCQAEEPSIKPLEESPQGPGANGDARRREGTETEQEPVGWPEMLRQHGSLDGCIEWLERGLVRDALWQAGGDRRYCARILGVCLRTIGNKLRKYGLQHGGKS